jgi:hypothetical protein
MFHWQLVLNQLKVLKLVANSNHWHCGKMEQFSNGEQETQQVLVVLAYASPWPSALVLPATEFMPFHSHLSQAATFKFLQSTQSG